MCQGHEAETHNPYAIEEEALIMTFYIIDIKFYVRLTFILRKFLGILKSGKMWDLLVLICMFYK